ncbi:MAG TPA: cation diffusion facilitator family transporter [Candidatus Eisenbacteria bacterium]|jgi:cation diffusion facilitator family transporter|nr:cation diffusion facilitator family transporter [Candidatus Eisenbacteria bacterium]
MTAPLQQTGDYARGMRSSLVGMGVNVLLATGKLVAGILGTSYALVADAIESLGDVVGSIVVWRGLQIASRPPDHNHPYGHGKAEPIAAALVSVMLVAAGTGIAFQAAREIASPHRAPQPFTLAVVLGVVAIKEGMFRFVHRVGSETGSHAVRTDAWHHRSDAITSLAAAIGISIALIGGRGWETADAWAALFASAIIIVNGWRMLRPAVEELMDQSPSSGLAEETIHVAESHAGVYRIEKLLFRKMGLYYVADMHLEVHPEMTVRESHALAHDVKEDVQRRFPQIIEVTIHVEPARDLAGVPPAASGPA